MLSYRCMHDCTPSDVAARHRFTKVTYGGGTADPKEFQPWVLQDNDPSTYVYVPSAANAYIQFDFAAPAKISRLVLQMHSSYYTQSRQAWIECVTRLVWLLYWCSRLTVCVSRTRASLDGTTWQTVGRITHNNGDTWTQTPRYAFKPYEFSEVVTAQYVRIIHRKTTSLYFAGMAFACDRAAVHVAEGALECLGDDCLVQVAMPSARVVVDNYIKGSTIDLDVSSVMAYGCVSVYACRHLAGFASSLVSMAMQFHLCHRQGLHL